MQWRAYIKGTVKEREPLKRHTTFRIGGPAKIFAEPQDEADLKMLLRLAKRGKITCLLLGAGSNILASDRGVNAAVIRLSSAAFTKISVSGSRMRVGAGCALRRAIALSHKYGLAGLECLAGIPGTVGAALVGNAGQGKAGGWIGDTVESVRVMDRAGRIRTLPRQRLRFGYRCSGLDGYIVLEACLRLHKGSPQKIRQKIRQALVMRKATLGISLPNAGCVFKNPASEPAGKLIELCGLKGRRSGGACVCSRHANFIVNTGGARSRDVRRLMDVIKKKVKEKFNVSLRPEIKIWN
ncbi:MAG TPA: UDP-N-acetylmuramate dehydrogenase [Patescibacteria group bacterium]|nr:UDP-N-acetylmuramate dehydrogenase [Patescibacteria group bacterium]